MKKYPAIDKICSFKFLNAVALLRYKQSGFFCRSTCLIIFMIFAPGAWNTLLSQQKDSIILEERFLELFYEGKRWWDIIRFNKTSELVPYFRDNPDNDYKLLWPIGLDILSLEPKVEQNPGYGDN